VIGDAQEGVKAGWGLVGKEGDLEGGALNELVGAFGPWDLLAIFEGEEFGELEFVLELPVDEVMVGGAVAETLENADGNAEIEAAFCTRFGDALENLLVGLGVDPVGDLFALSIGEMSERGLRPDFSV